MNATKRAEFRKRLMDEREHLAAEWKNHGGIAGAGGGWDTRDVEERAVSIPNAAIDRQITEDERNLLLKIDFALQRLDDGSYGRCTSCSQAIPLERLQAKPSVSLCLPCQQDRDNSKH